MPNREVLNEFLNRELLTLGIFLTFKARKTALTISEFVETARAQGQDIQAIRRVLLDDLDNGGRIFGEFRSAIRATSNGTINRLRDDGLFSEVGINQRYRWAAVLIKTCPDCLDRHNMEPMEWEEWEAIGLPRTGSTVCKENCRCMLIPSEFTVKEPVMRSGRN